MQILNDWNEVKGGGNSGRFREIRLLNAGRRKGTVKGVMSRNVRVFRSAGG